MTKRSSQEVDAQAANWAAAVDAGPLSPKSQAALNAWLQADARHFGAYAKARAVMVHTERAAALGPEFDPSQFVRPSHKVLEWNTLSRRRLVWPASVAACIMILIAGASLLDLGWGAQSYSTSVGETRVVPLADGSTVTLNTNSRIRVSFTQDRRGIDLVQGEALFDVAKNKHRPFIVEANGTSVRAVGTSFTVSVLPNRPVQVLVREGVVEVKRTAVPVAPPVSLPANSRAVAPRDAPIVTATVDQSEIRRSLSWRVGRLTFERETLANAVATFSRYSDTHIEIVDPGIAELTVTGLFVSNDPIGFSKAVALSLGLRATVVDNGVKLSR